MTDDDLVRKRIDTLLRDVREQHDNALSTLADGLMGTFAARTEELRREVEAAIGAQMQARMDAVEAAATSRIAQTEADAAAKLDALRADAAAERQRADADADRQTAAAEARIAEVERDRDERIAAVERDRDERIAAVERDRDERIAAVERDREARLAEVEQDREARLAAVEREREAQIAEFESALAAASSGADAVASEREADLARLERLLDGLRALDVARTLSDVLDAAAVHAARETARVAVLLVRGDRLRGWRAIGFDAAGIRDAAAIDVDVREGGIVTRAARTGRRAATSDREAMPAAVATLSPPSFASLPADRVGFAVPIAVGGHVVAVLYADDVGDVEPRVPDGWPEAIEILARHTGRCLEALTASRAVTAGITNLRSAAPPAAKREAGESPDEAAKRYAKLLVSEIKLYHQPAVDAGRRARDLAERLAPEIARARGLYDERIGLDVRSRSDYFNQELVRTLADGNPLLLGARRSSPAS